MLGYRILNIGKYKLGSDTLSVMRKDDGFFLDVGDTRQWKLHFTDNTHFFVFENKIDFNFIIDTTKNVTGLTINEERATKIE